MNKVRNLLLFIFVFTGWSAFAQKVTFNVETPGVVAVGELVKIEFVANTKPKKFIEPTFPEGIDVLAGPSSSVSRNIVVTNGNMVQENKFSYVYVLRCNTEGEFTVSEAGVEVDKEVHNTKPFVIKAINERDIDSQTTANGEQKSIIAPDDVFIRAIVNKTRVFKGEPVKVVFKFYTRLATADYQWAKRPAFNGFWSQQLTTQGYAGRQREAYKDKIYTTWSVEEYLLFPQIAGTLTIDPLELNVLVQIAAEQRARSVFDDFFGGPNTREVSLNISTEPVKINVIDLPSGAPASFSGAVGEFEMTAEPLPTEISANSATTFTVKISGSGNLPQIQAPKLSLPASFERYNVKTTETLNNSELGIYGYRQFEYPIIARVDGDYTLPSVEFSYFNPKKSKYETISAPDMQVRVMPDSSVSRGGDQNIIAGLSKDDVKILGSDIRFIKLGSHDLRSKDNVFINSWLYYILLLSIIGTFVFLFIFLRKLMAERRNLALLKGKQANKVALLRFRAAEQYMKEGNQRGFYEEMLKALWGYLSDKLNIPQANLTKENVREELSKKGISTEHTARYIDIITDCEYAQYAPSASSMRMNELYMTGIEIISKFESIIGR